VIFDKTGTLTMGQPRVVDVVTAAGVSTDELLALAASAEQGSEHPLAKAILQQAQGLPLAKPMVSRTATAWAQSPR